MKSGEKIGDDLRDGNSEVQTIALYPDGKKVLSGSDDSKMRLGHAKSSRDRRGIQKQ